jgi:hypothetical protein
MEENENDMSLFNSDNLELNFDINYNEEELQDENPDKDKKDLIDEDTDDELQENVDEEDEDKDEGDSKDDDASPNLYTSFSDVLIEHGIIPSLESSEKIKTINDLGNAISKQIEIEAERKAISKLDNLDLEKIGQSRKENLELESITEDYLKENLEVAKNIILKDYMNQGLSEDRAKKQLKKAIDLGEDVVIEEALESTGSLKEFNKRAELAEVENSKQRLLDEAKEQEEINNTIKNFVFNSKEVIQGIPNTKALQDKVYKSMTEVVSKNTETGEMMNKFMTDRSKNPIEFDTKMYYLYELTNGFANLGNIQKTITSKSVKNLENVLRKTSFEDNGTPDYLNDSQSYGGIGAELVL